MLPDSSKKESIREPFPAEIIFDIRDSDVDSKGVGVRINMAAPEPGKCFSLIAGSVAYLLPPIYCHGTNDKSSERQILSDCNQSLLQSSKVYTFQSFSQPTN